MFALGVMMKPKCLDCLHLDEGGRHIYIVLCRLQLLAGFDFCSVANKFGFSNQCCFSKALHFSI